MNTTSLVRTYLDQHPSLRDCLRDSVINYSRLARKIAQELGIQKKTSMEAVLIACRRYAQNLQGEKTRERKIREILQKSSIELKNRMTVFVIEKRVYTDELAVIERRLRKHAEVFYAIEGSAAFTLILPSHHREGLIRIIGNGLIKETGNCALINIRSPEEIELVSGIVAYLYSCFSERGINIIETMSCWTDTMFIIEEKDAAQALQILPR